jgi:Lrp/AsnC family transcriptional regulator for asnA, asnC and gidA
VPGETNSLLAISVKGVLVFSINISSIFLSLNLDYTLLGYSFIAYIGVLADRSGQTYGILESLKKIPHVTVAHLMTGKYNVICKIRAKNTKHAKDVIWK